MTVRILPRALTELERWLEHVGRDNQRAAVEFATEVFSTIERLAAGDFEGPETVLRNGQRVRSWPVPPLRIYYQRGTDELRVLRLYHQARRTITR